MKSFRNLVEAKMSRQHFQGIADVIRNLELPKAKRMQVAESFADWLEETNTLFKRDKFMLASKGKQDDLDANKPNKE